MRLINRALTTSALLFLGAAAALSQETQQYTLFIQEQNGAEQAEKYARQYLPKDAAVSICVLPAHRGSLQDAELQAQAIRAGITHLPSISFADSAGPYAVLPLNALNKASLEDAHARAESPDRKQMTEIRELHARLYMLCAQWSVSAELSDEMLAQFVSECRDLLQHPQSGEKEKQFIGYSCLYPALMLQYERGYKGAHSPYTEAKLLKAIAALEAARDLNKESKLGKRAFAERERLRKARREARKYE